MEAQMNTTTRTHAARRNTALAVQRTVTERLAARLEANEPARTHRPRVDMIVPGEEVLRLPDFIDADGMAVFVGEEATVMVEPTVMRDLDRLLHVGGVKARGGHMPDEEGIAVFPHADAYQARCYTGRNAEAQTQWRLAHDTLLVNA
jgi:hypothetical protein